MEYLEADFNWKDPDLVSAIDETPFWSAPFGATLLQRVRFKKELVVLDLCSGTGFPLLILAGRLGPGARLFGIDPWTAGNARARRKLLEYGYSNTSILSGFAESIPLKNETVNLAVSNNGLNNVNCLESSLKECFRVCRPGAQLLATLNLPETMHEFYEVFQRVLENNRVPDAVELIEAHIRAKRPSIAHFTSAVEKSGFVIRDVHTDFFTWRFVDGSAMLRDYAIRLAFLTPWKELVPTALQKHVFTEVEILLNELSAKNGELVLTIPFACFDARKPG
jgi:arsenite methyltransferase